MELLQLKYFYKIANSRTLTQAADELNVSQPSLSRMISRLEDEFEMEFFDRNGRNITLNKNGEVFLHYCTQIMNSLDEMRTDLSELKKRKDLQVSVGFYSMSSMLIDIIGNFRRLYPNIQIRVLQHYHEDDSDSSLDLIVNSAVPGKEPEGSTILVTEDILLAVPKGEKEKYAQGEDLPISSLAKIPVISLVKGRPIRDIADYYLKEANVKPNIVVETDSPVTLRKMIIAGDGITFFPEKAWKLDEQENIDFIKFQPPCKRSVYVRWNRLYYKSYAARLFYNFLVEYFKSEAFSG
mgnify:CR=1 FL=1